MQRYTEDTHSQMPAYMDEDPQGDWVKYDDAQATIARLTEERDNALSMIRIAYNAGYYQAECGLPNHGDINRAATEALNKRIRAEAAAAYEKIARAAEDRAWSVGLAGHEIRALATEPGTTALAEMLDAETRACAEVMQPMLRSMLSRGEAYRAILARIDQRKEVRE